MKGYRLYFLDHAGHIRHALELECESDDGAVDQAAERADGSAMELWQRDRVIRKFEALPAAARTGP